MACTQLVLARAPRLRMVLNMTRSFTTIEESRTWVSQQTGADPETVRRWELGEEHMPEHAVAILADLLGVTDTFLLGFEDPRESDRRLLVD
jgi:hypothetical protein